MGRALAMLVLLAAGAPLTPPPETPAGDLVENLHGVEVADPYRWLEDGDDPAVGAWADAQTARAREWFDTLPGRARLESRMAELLGTGSIGTPVVRQGRLFWTRREPGQDHAVLMWASSHLGEARVLLDPNGWSEDGTVALDWWSPSHDGRLVAFGQSEGGSERSTLHVVDVLSSEWLAEAIPNARAAAPAWDAAGEGFWYARYPQAGEVPEGDEAYYRKIHYHALGSPWEEDPVVFGEGRPKEEWPSAWTDPTGSWLVVEASRGWDESSLFVADLSAAGPPTLVAVVDGEDGSWSGFVEGGWLWVHERTKEVSNGRLLRLRAANADRGLAAAEVVVPEGESPLDAAWWAAGQVVLSYQESGRETIRLMDPVSLTPEEMPLPGLGTVGGPTGDRHGWDLFYTYQSFDTPPAVYRHSVRSGEREVWDRVEYPVDPSGLEVSLVRYPSADGTEVTMFLVHRDDIALDGDNPVMLSGYGGFNVSMRPYFSATAFPFLEAGGVWAVPHLRGGGEYGESWHQAGMLANKQNTFDDFIAAAEWLVSQGYTRPERLAISGGSNGGLLVGAAMTQRPDLFRAVVCTVPLLDMVRYHLFQIARLWIPEYGDPDDPEEFGWLHAYSPYHRVPEGGTWPDLLLMTADQDSRVDPLHARKFAARVQAAHPQALTLLRVEKKAGHGQGKPISMWVEELTDRWGFLMHSLGMTLPGDEEHGVRALAGGDLPPGLAMEFDDPRFGPGDQEVERLEDGYRVKVNGNAVFWLEGWEAGGDFSFTATVRQHERHAGHAHYAGLAVGGAPGERRFSYFSLNSQGKWLARRFSGSPEVLRLRGPEDTVAAIRLPAGEATGTVENILEVRAVGEAVEFLVNGATVAILPRSEIAPEGTVGFRLGHLLDVEITGISLKPL